MRKQMTLLYWLLWGLRSAHYGRQFEILTEEYYPFVGRFYK